MFINFKRLLLTLYRLEEGQQQILAKLDELERKKEQFVQEPKEKAADEWLQEGLSNIMAFQAGGKKGEKE